MSDLISRQDAYQVIDRFLGYLDEDMINRIKLKLNQDCPSVQPERKKGEWIRNENGTYSCSVCQSWIPEEQHYYARYCLYCGADMRGEQDG